MQNSIKIGLVVLTRGGNYGKVVDKIIDVYVVEFGLNKSVRVNVHKSAISTVSSPNLEIESDSDDE